MAKRHFTPALFTFLRELEQNNGKSWWDENKGRYEETVQAPALEFIADFAPRLAGISAHFTADARTVGGSLMRPYRDIRFSPDKTPYKTNVGIQFRHESGKDVHAPGFYLHLELPVRSPGWGFGVPRRPRPPESAPTSQRTPTIGPKPPARASSPGTGLWSETRIRC